MLGLLELRFFLARGQEGVEAEAGVEAEEIGTGIHAGAGFGEGDGIDLVDGHGFPAGEHEGLGGGVAVLDRVGAVGVGGHVERGAFLGSGLAMHGFENPVGGVLARVFFESCLELGIFEFVFGADELCQRHHLGFGGDVEGLPPVLLTALEGADVHVTGVTVNVRGGDTNALI